MFGLCATLVGLGYFEEVRVDFLLVGHMYSDIDQRFSSISHVLKGDDINSLSELLKLLQNQILGQLYRHTRFNAADDVIQMYQTVIVETKAFIEYL
jgi:hypothetical protein